MNPIVNEFYIISGLLHKPEIQVYVFDMIESDHFENQTCKAVFNFIKRENEVNKIKPDFIYFNKQFVLSEFYNVKGVNLEEISNLIDYKPLGNINFHINEIYKKYELKKTNDYVAMIEDIKSCGIDSLDSIEAVKDVCRKVLESRERRNSAQTAYEIFQKSKEVLHKVRKGEYKVNLVKSGWNNLDSFTGGFERGEFIIILARTGMGKTRFVMPYIDRIINNRFNEDNGCYLFSIEEKKKKMLNYLIANKTGIDTKRLKHMELSDHEIKSYEAVSFDGMRLIIDDERDKCSLDYIERKIEIMVEGYGIRNFFIDTMNEINHKGMKNTEFMNHASSKIKGLVKTYDCRIFALCQMNRQSEGRERKEKRPQPYDVRDSDNAYTNCDHMLGLYCDDKYKLIYGEDKELDRIFEAIVLKTRDGIEGARACFISDLGKCQFNEVTNGRF